MKKLLLALVMCLGVNAYSNDYEGWEPFGFQFNESTPIFDSDTGLHLNIPSGMTRSWVMWNPECGIEVDLFTSKDMFDDYYMVLLAKCPYEGFFDDDDFEDDSGLIMSEVQRILPIGNVYIEKNGTVFTSQVKPSLVSDADAMRYRMYCTLDGDDLEVYFDVHVFKRNGYACILATGTFPDADEGELDYFTNQVVNTAYFDPDGE